MSNGLDLLIGDYEQRLLTIKEEISKNIGKIKCSRLEVKTSCYKWFLMELKKLKNDKL